MVGPAPFCYGEREMAPDYLRTLFLHPPSREGFDGGAGSRYQARREIRSFWYPTGAPPPPGAAGGAQARRAESPRLTVGRGGGAVADAPGASLEASRALDFVAGNE